MLDAIERRLGAAAGALLDGGFVTKAEITARARHVPIYAPPMQRAGRTRPPDQPARRFARRRRVARAHGH